MIKCHTTLTECPRALLTIYKMNFNVFCCCWTNLTQSPLFSYICSFFFFLVLASSSSLSAIDNVFVPVIWMTRTTATTDVNDRQSGSSSDRRSGQLGRRHDVTLGGPSVFIHWLLLSVNGFHCLCLYFV